MATSEGDVTVEQSITSSVEPFSRTRNLSHRRLPIPSTSISVDCGTPRGTGPSTSTGQSLREVRVVPDTGGDAETTCRGSGQSWSDPAVVSYIRLSPRKRYIGAVPELDDDVCRNLSNKSRGTTKNTGPLLRDADVLPDTSSDALSTGQLSRDPGVILHKDNADAVLNSSEQSHHASISSEPSWRDLVVIPDRGSDAAVNSSDQSGSGASLGALRTESTTPDRPARRKDVTELNSCVELGQVTSTEPFRESSVCI